MHIKLSIFNSTIHFIRLTYEDCHIIHPKGVLFVNIRKKNRGYTSIFSNSVVLQFLIELVSVPYCGHMIPIPIQVTHGDTHSKSNADIQQNLPTKLADNRRKIADLIGARRTRRWRVLRPVNDGILQT